MRAHFRYLRSKSFPMIYKTPQVIEFWPLQSPFEDSGFHQDSNSQSGTPLGCEGSFPHTFSHSCEYVMWLSASLLARNLANPRLGRKLKARVTTSFFYKTLQAKKKNNQNNDILLFFKFPIACTKREKKNPQ